MTTNTLTTDSGLDWLDLLPEGAAPTGMRAALEHHAHQSAAVERRHAALADAKTRLTAALANFDDFPGVGTDSKTDTVADLAHEVAIHSQVIAHTAPVLAPDETYADQVVASIAQWFADRPAVLGAPPLVLAELRHFEEMNHDPGELRPRITDAEYEAIPTFEKVAAEAHTIQQSVALFMAPCSLDLLPGRVRAWADFVPTYEAHRNLVAGMRKATDNLDQDRITKGQAHVCRFMGGLCGPMMTVEEKPLDSGPWTVAWSQRLGDGRPVAVAR